MSTDGSRDTKPPTPRAAHERLAEDLRRRNNLDTSRERELLARLRLGRG